MPNSISLKKIKKNPQSFSFQSPTCLSICQILIEILGHISRCVFPSQFPLSAWFYFRSAAFVSGLDRAGRPDLTSLYLCLPLPQFYSACCQRVLRRRWRKSSGTTPPYRATISSARPTHSTSSGYCINRTPNRKWWDKIFFFFLFYHHLSVVIRQGINWKESLGNCKFTLSWQWYDLS